uniref:Prominin-2 n=1 Tax=Echinostoma caproni TaxID=27848 RepID=A0A183AP61_9TREM
LDDFNNSLVRLTQELPSIRTELVETLDPNCPLDKHIKCVQLMQEAQKSLQVRYTLDQTVLSACEDSGICLRAGGNLLDPNCVGCLLKVQFQTVDLSTLIEQLERHRNDFQSLTDLNNTLQTLAGVIKKAIEKDLNRAWDDLVHSPETREKLARSFEGSLREIKRGLALVRERLEIHQDVQSSQIFIQIVEFQFYGGIALLCIPVLIFLLFYLGLCFGTCGHRPYEEAGVCNRGVGANLLLAGVGFVFLFSTILMFVCVVLFMAGGPLQTELCRYLTGHVPDGPRKLDDYLHESVQYMIEQVRREARLNQELAAEQNAQRYTTVDLSTAELVRNITRARLTDAILTRCENEPFVDAISGGQFMWPALYEPIQSILQELIDSFKTVNLNKPLEDTIQSCSETLERIKFLDSVNFSRAINQVSKLIATAYTCALTLVYILSGSLSPKLHDWCVLQTISGI